ncbi:ribosome maturation factor RimP [uncultured Olsenella sp.]|uniref:ribosome maturation factor RimP n=1 Tax=uncultured Olsenella sp. TaxID=190764 RepID=UPI0026DD6A0B|nr:ribosome maturation factor RimP [uncultured Olsenella sp.]
MASTDLEKRLVAALEEAAAPHGIDVVDVEVVGSAKAPTVRVRIDHADEGLPTISLDEVAAQSGWINEALDAFDPIEGSYTLEVSSPGLSRPLRRARDFERFAGQDVSLTTTATEGRRRFAGRLLGIEGQLVRIECEGEELAFELGQIKSCKIKPNFDRA